LYIREFGAEGLIGTDADGKDRTVCADHVVIALGSVPRRELALRIEGNMDEIFVVGDCADPRGITRAIREGFAARWRI
jgi:2,4-dienoyl-CoA reductase (NADPH2)